MKESWQERRKKQRHTSNYKRPFLPFLKKIGLYPTGNRRLFKDLKQKSDMTYKQLKKVYNMEDAGTRLVAERLVIVGDKR